MQKAGDYKERLLWKKATKTADDTGDRALSYSDNGYLWANVRQESATEGEQYGGRNHVVSATIRIRNYPSVSNIDRLYHARWGETYQITGITRGDNELILDAEVVGNL